MKLFKAHRWAVMALTMLAGPALVQAQVLRCNMQTPCGSTMPCAGGCLSSTPIAHPTASPCVAGHGSFDLIGTQFENTCSLGMGGCPVMTPPMRFWQFDHYDPANNGCQAQNDTVNNLEYLVNASLDDLTPGLANGHWYMWQPNWSGPMVDKCYTGAPGPPTPRTVVELSAVDARPGFEGTTAHAAWYILASVPLTANGFDFDTITGGTGCTPQELQKQPVPTVSVMGRSLPCTNNTTPTTSQTADALTGYFDTAVTISNPNPNWWTEAGLNGAPALISGFQIMYKMGTDPTTSASSAWLPVYDPTDATAPKNALGVVPVGTAGPITIALPVTTSTTNYWLALRIVYADASENPTAPFDPTAAGLQGPQITSPVGTHCGPVNFNPGIQTAVEFDSVTAERTSQGVNVRWTTLREDDTYAFKVYRSNEAGTESTEAASWVDAHGSNLEYVVSDLSAGPGAYYYYVQEFTSNGLGDRSPSVRVEANAVGQRGGSSGGRSRGSRR